MSASETTQDEPTRPRPIDPQGRTLDAWGLPITGPSRIAALAGRVDPAVDSTGWSPVPIATEPAHADVLVLDTLAPAAPAAPAAPVLVPAPGALASTFATE